MSIVYLPVYVYMCLKIVDFLQLGAGTALPGIVAAKCGAQVTLSDSASFAKCLRNCCHSCEVNGLEHVKVIGLTWGQFTLELMSLEPMDVILGSDCFYDKKGRLCMMF